MSTPNIETEVILESLRKAVAKALDRKRRLGQYAVVWRDERVTIVPPEDLPELPRSEKEAESEELVPSENR
jgi:hypothetical protein